MANHQSISLELVSPLSLESDPTPEADPIQQVPHAAPPDGGYPGWLQDNSLPDSADSLDRYKEEYKPWCTEDGQVAVTIDLPTPNGSPGDLHASHGTLSPGSRTISERNQSIAVRDAASINLGVKVQGSLSASWEGPVIGSDGDSLSPPPPLSIAGSIISWGVRVTGTLRVSYSEEHLQYTLTLPPRQNMPPGSAKEDAYASTLYLTDDQGNTTTHEVELPDMSGECPGGSSLSTGGDDDEDEEEEGCVRLNLEVDPCTGEVIREWTESIKCPGEGGDA